MPFSARLPTKKLAVLIHCSLQTFSRQKRETIRPNRCSRTRANKRSFSTKDPPSKRAAKGVGGGAVWTEFAALNRPASRQFSNLLGDKIEEHRDTFTRTVKRQIGPFRMALKGRASPCNLQRRRARNRKYLFYYRYLVDSLFFLYFPLSLFFSAFFFLLFFFCPSLGGEIFSRWTPTSPNIGRFYIDGFPAIYAGRQLMNLYR